MVTQENNTYWNLQYPNNLTFNFQILPNSTSLNKEVNIYKNYTVYKTIYGDCNRDDVVDIFDCVILGNVFGLNSTSGWNINCTKNDWVKDEVIDIYDLVKLGDHFGDTLP